MMRIDGAIWLGAFLVSLSLHAALFYRAQPLLGLDEQESAARAHTTRVSFRAESVAPQPQPPEAKPEPKPEPEPEPEPKAEAKSEAPVQPQSEEPRRPAEPQAAPAPPPSVTSAESEALRAQARRHYLARLMAHIEGHKHYPRSARRRGIEGKVGVRFRLLEGGVAEGIELEGGHRLLRKAVTEAMRSAQPLPRPPDGLALPLPVEFAIRFQLH